MGDERFHEANCKKCTQETKKNSWDILRLTIFMYCLKTFLRELLHRIIPISQLFFRFLHTFLAVFCLVKPFVHCEFQPRGLAGFKALAHRLLRMYAMWLKWKHELKNYPVTLAVWVMNWHEDFPCLLLFANDTGSWNMKRSLVLFCQISRGWWR